MGLIANLAERVVNAIAPPPSAAGSVGWTPVTGGPQTFQQFARRGYMGNEIVFSAIELLATSAAEPHIAGRRWRRASPTIRGMENKPLSDRERLVLSDRIRCETSRLLVAGVPLAEVAKRLVSNGFVIQVPDHPLVRILNNPNPFMSRGQFWSTAVMDRALAGNFYALKARYTDGPLAGAVGELWRLRPDRVRVIPDKATFCKYQYTVPGSAPVVFENRDIIQWKTRNPLDDYYGMPPLMVLSRRISIDEYMSGYLQGFFEHGGTGPGSILTTKTKLSDEHKKEIRDRMQRQFGPGNWLGMMVIDNNESTYQQLGLNRGLRDALPKEIDAQTEARIAMVFGIPGSILGLLIGYESSSYANKRADREVFWKITMAPLLSDLDDVLNLSLTPEFGGIDEVYFDLSDIEALQEEVDKKVARWLKVLGGGGCSLEEFRDATGLDPENLDGTFLIPANIIPTRGEALGETPPDTAMAAVLRATLAPKAIEAPVIVEEPVCPDCGRRVGKNVNVGASLPCPRCRDYFLVEA